MMQRTLERMNVLAIDIASVNSKIAPMIKKKRSASRIRKLRIDLKRNQIQWQRHMVDAEQIKITLTDADMSGRMIHLRMEWAIVTAYQRTFLLCRPEMTVVDRIIGSTFMAETEKSLAKTVVGKIARERTPTMNGIEKMQRAILKAHAAAIRLQPTKLLQQLAVFKEVKDKLSVHKILELALFHAADNVQFHKLAYV